MTWAHVFWGEIVESWNNTLPTEYTYTGQREASATGGLRLLDYGARHYVPWLGRFIAPDTLVPAPGNPQSLNRYAYANNNPLKYTDPTGHNAACAPLMGGGPLGVLAALGCEVGYAVASYGPQLIQLAANLSQFAASPQGQVALQLAQQANAGLNQAASNASNAAQQAASQAGNTAGPGGLDPNDPLFKKLIEQTGEADPIKAIAKASTRGPATERGITVLGHYPEYVIKAKELNATYLDFVEGTWALLSAKLSLAQAHNMV